jgi:two-component system, cell cycle sensor histidine kinase and response regulator CckA
LSVFEEMSMESTELRPATSPQVFSEGTSAEENIEGILLVEDESFVRDVTGEVLKAAGHVVWKARNATEAVRVFRRHAAHIKLLIVDVMLPDRSGPVLALELEGMGGIFRTILISGYPERSVKYKLNMLDCSYLPKPFSAELLISRVRDVLDSSRLPPLKKAEAAGLTEGDTAHSPSGGPRRDTNLTRK